MRVENTENSNALSKDMQTNENKKNRRKRRYMFSCGDHMMHKNNHHLTISPSMLGLEGSEYIIDKGTRIQFRFLSSTHPDI